MRAAGLAFLVLLAACGESPVDAGRGAAWQTCTIAGIRAAGGLAVHRGDLLVVSGRDDRDLRAFAIEDLQPGVTVTARVLRRQVNENALLMGGEPFALEGYEIEHLWKQTLDFQALATQPPHFVYLGDRVRRVAYWGTLLGDAQGRTDRVRIMGAFTIPGAKRTDVASGDWRDKGPGLAGFVSVGARRRSEDFYAVDGGSEGGSLRIYKVNRYSSLMGAIRVRHGFSGAPGVAALSLGRSAFLLRHGENALASVPEPRGEETVGMKEEAPPPVPPQGHAWTGMCHGPDGTLYLISNGDPARLAWRRQP